MPLQVLLSGKLPPPAAIRRNFAELETDKKVASLKVQQATIIQWTTLLNEPQSGLEDGDGEQQPLPWNRTKSCVIRAPWALIIRILGVVLSGLFELTSASSSKKREPFSSEQE